MSGIIVISAVYLITGITSLYLNVRMLKRNYRRLGYNTIFLSLLALVSTGFLLYIDENSGGWQNFKTLDGGSWLCILVFTSVFMCIYTGLFLLIKPKPKTT